MCPLTIRMRWKRPLALVLMLTLVLAGCGSSASRHPGALRLPLYPGEALADPARATTSSQAFMVSLLYSGLVRYAPDLHVIPDLAVSIPTISGDGSTYTFTVRRDARFADGTRCRASDVAYSLARALSPEVHSSMARRYLGGIQGAAAVEKGSATTLSGVQVLDPLTVRVRLDHPDANFLQKLAFPAGYVVDHRATRHGRLSITRPAGTGPWILDSHQPDGSLYFLPRRHFYGGPLQLRSLMMIPVADSGHSIALYRKGALDASYVSSASFGSWSGNPDFHTAAALTGYYVVPAHPSAGSWGRLDRQQLLGNFSGALGPLDSIVPPAVPDYVPSGGATTGSSLDDPTSVRIAGSSSDPMLRELRSALITNVKSGTAGRAADITITRKTYLLPVPAVWLSMVLPQTESPWFRHKLSTASALTNDPVGRMEVYSTLEQWALNRHLIVPLASGSVGYVIKPSISNLEVTALGLMPANGTWNTVQVG